MPQNNYFSEMVGSKEFLVGLISRCWLQMLLRCHVNQVGEVLLVFLPLVLGCVCNSAEVAVLVQSRRR